jgi:hypothetical protein
MRGANETKGLIMNTNAISISDVTYAVIDSYAKKHFVVDYSSLPDPSTIEIVTIPDEQFQPASSNWPCMWDQRVKIGQLIEQQSGASTTSSDTEVYASAKVHRARSFGSDENSAINVRFSSSEKQLSDRDWPNLQLIQPCKEIQVGLKQGEPVERRRLEAMAIYYLMANGHLERFITSSMEFLRDFKASCRCIAATREAPAAPPLTGDHMLPSRSQNPRPTHETNDSTRTLKREREDEDAGYDRHEDPNQDDGGMPVSIL